MPDSSNVRQNTATVEQRVDAIEAVMHDRGMNPAPFIDEFKHTAEETWIPGERCARGRQGHGPIPSSRSGFVANGKAAESASSG